MAGSVKNVLAEKIQTWLKAAVAMATTKVTTPFSPLHYNPPPCVACILFCKTESEKPFLSPCVRDVLNLSIK